MSPDFAIGALIGMTLWRVIWYFTGGYKEQDAYKQGQDEGQDKGYGEGYQAGLWDARQGKSKFGLDGIWGRGR